MMLALKICEYNYEYCIHSNGCLIQYYIRFMPLSQDELYPYRYDIMFRCWENQADERPKFAELVCTISTILEGIAGYMDLSLIPTCVDASVTAEGEDPKLTLHLLSGLTSKKTVCNSNIVKYDFFPTLVFAAIMYVMPLSLP